MTEKTVRKKDKMSLKVGVSCSFIIEDEDYSKLTNASLAKALRSGLHTLYGIDTVENTEVRAERSIQKL